MNRLELESYMLQDQMDVILAFCLRKRNGIETSRTSRFVLTIVQTFRCKTDIMTEGVAIRFSYATQALYANYPRRTIIVPAHSTSFPAIQRVINII